MCRQALTYSYYPSFLSSVLLQPGRHHVHPRARPLPSQRPPNPRPRLPLPNQRSRSKPRRRTRPPWTPPTARRQAGDPPVDGHGPGASGPPRQRHHRPLARGVHPRVSVQGSPGGPGGLGLAQDRPIPVLPHREPHVEVRRGQGPRGSARV